MMNPENGAIINQYKIISSIGAGGMGEVFLAQDTKLDRKVALKILPPEFAEDQDRMNRFVREAKSASALNHPNIITIHEIGESDGTHYIATEFIEGETLQTNLKNQSLNLKSALEIAVQVVSALDAAHRAGIVHRDIKPENVMLRPDGLVKILDFGIAKLSAPPAVASVSSEDATAIKPHSTSPGMVIGTANYMSPEQARGKEIDARSDIFSFGIVFYEMLTGRRAFAGETALESISSILKDEPLPISRLLPEVPPEIERIVGKTLRKAADERYQTAKDLLIDLKDARQNLELQNLLERTVSPDKEEPKTQILPATTADETDQTTTNQTVSSNSRNKYLAIGLAVLLFSAIGFFVSRYFTPTKQIESIAVMPFVNESGNQDVEYLSDGMTETLIKSLSSLPNLNVKPRSSVFRYKGKDTDLQTIAGELNVQAILTGRVVQRGDQITLSLELVDVQKDSVIWTESYNRKQSELVSLQSEIAKDVSTNLKSKLSGAEEIKVTKTATSEPEAYQAYLKGRFYWNKRDEENLKKAIEQFKIATDRDPNFALAFVGLADCYVVLPYYSVTSNDVLPQAKAYAKRALEIDDSLGEAHTALGYVERLSWNRVEAEKELKRGIELSPKYATAHHWYGNFLVDAGRFDEALAAFNRAQELEPLSLIIGNNLAEIYLAKGDLTAAFEQCRRVIDLDPNWSRIRLQLALVHLRQGQKAEAISEVRKGVETSKRQSYTLGFLGYIYAQTGERSKAEAVIQELQERYANRQANGYDLARIYAGLGEKDQAFAWLEKDFQSQNPTMHGYLILPPLDLLRDDPRFKDLLRRMNLPE